MSTASSNQLSTHPSATDEVVDLCRDLIRIDSSNYGDGSGPGERRAAEHVLGLLDEVGIEAELLESERNRSSVVFRLEGEDSTRPALVLHGHLDVVPAQAADWQVDPFAGEIRDGCLWGRGAVDMKDMDAMMLAVLRARLGLALALALSGVLRISLGVPVLPGDRLLLRHQDRHRLRGPARRGEVPGAGAAAGPPCAGRRPPATDEWSERDRAAARWYAPLMIAGYGVSIAMLLLVALPTTVRFWSTSWTGSPAPAGSPPASSPTPSSSSCSRWPSSASSPTSRSATCAAVGRPVILRTPS